MEYVIQLWFVQLDRSMQLNEGRFLMNGRCGYVLQPDCMRADGYNPYNASTLKQLKSAITITIMVGTFHVDTSLIFMTTWCSALIYFFKTHAFVHSLFASLSNCVFCQGIFYNLLLIINYSCSFADPGRSTSGQTEEGSLMSVCGSRNCWLRLWLWKVQDKTKM